TITISLPMLPGATTNTATVTSANADPNPTNNASSVQLDVVTSAQIPVLSPLMLALFALTLAGVALLFR
ncbi:MAG TPA: hypothetical protein VF698_11810, partial [Thermoanaerobaculia bacterium]